MMKKVIRGEEGCTIAFTSGNGLDHVECNGGDNEWGQVCGLCQERMADERVDRIEQAIAALVILGGDDVEWKTRAGLWAMMTLDKR